MYDYILSKNKSRLIKKLSWEDYDDTYDGEQVFAAIARLSKKRHMGWGVMICEIVR